MFDIFPKCILFLLALFCLSACLRDDLDIKVNGNMSTSYTRTHNFSGGTSGVRMGMDIN